MKQKKTTGANPDLRAVASNYTKIRQEYAFNPDIFCPDDTRVREVKRIIEGLDEADKTIFRLYADCGSIRELAKVLHISRGSVWKEVKRIKEQILREYENTNESKSRS